MRRTTPLKNFCRADQVQGIHEIPESMSLDIVPRRRWSWRHFSPVIESSVLTGREVEDAAGEHCPNDRRRCHIELLLVQPPKLKLPASSSSRPFISFARPVRASTTTRVRSVRRGFRSLFPPSSSSLFPGQVFGGSNIFFLSSFGAMGKGGRYATRDI